MAVVQFNILPVRRVRVAAGPWKEPANAAARAKDDLVLAALRLRRLYPSAEVAQKVGQSPEWVRTATNRVMADDLATPDAGASRAKVAAAYAFRGVAE